VVLGILSPRGPLLGILPSGKGKHKFFERPREV